MATPNGTVMATPASYEVVGDYTTCENLRAAFSRVNIPRTNKMTPLPSVMATAQDGAIGLQSFCTFNRKGTPLCSPSGAVVNANQTVTPAVRTAVLGALTKGSMVSTRDMEAGYNQRRSRYDADSRRQCLSVMQTSVSLDKQSPYNPAAQVVTGIRY